MAIHVSQELTNAIQKSARASTRLLKAAKSADQERIRGAMRSWLSAQEERRGIWRAMSPPLPADEEPGQQRDGKSTEE